MSRIAEIFLRVRDTLNDHQKQRWSDDTLMRNLNEAVNDIATQAHLFKNSAAISLVNGQEIYNLPEHILELSHVTFNWKPLPLKSSGWMNHNRETDWRYTQTTGAIALAVFDEIKRRQLRIYPRPFGDYTTEYASFDTVYGVTVGVSDFDFDSSYGVVANIADPEINSELANSVYGVMVSIESAEAFVIYYSECPPSSTSIDQDPPIDACFDTALKFYVTGLALRNDVDATNRNMANEEFVLYNRTLDQIKELAETDSVSAPNFESHYNPMG